VFVLFALIFLDSYSTTHTHTLSLSLSLSTEGMTVKAFLHFIGKECDEYEEVFESFDQLMTMKTLQMKENEIPVQQRRWILKWVEKYKRGLFPDLQELRRRGREIPI
jgi:IGR protein motif